ncbi:Ig-like domain repeat protein [uncultured Treponema sp.]|uniref:Ig-like domain repeat protein n=1 Tax=uncultured Treponema sp. TaxID=162155 RepID=UPI0025EAC22E|nr:Ig-like domain repeat protein [uncultured Treponema sp.]
MKKVRNGNVVFSKISKLVGKGLLALSVLALASCGENSGLGSSVDTEAPKLSISYPPAASEVRGAFVLAGTCSDDKGVSSVKVRVTNLDTNEIVYKDLPATVVNSLTWNINLNEKLDLKDGKYKLDAVAYDNSGRSSGESSLQIEIDNTPPVFIISKPGVVKSTYKAKNSLSKYGSVFTIEGTIADDHTIASMDVEIFDADGNPVASEPYTEEEISTTGGTSVTIARYVAEGTDVVNKRYSEMYSSESVPEDANGNKTYFCRVTVSDSAKTYNTPGDSGVKGGNSTSNVYIYDDIYDKYLSAKNGGAGLSAKDLLAVLKGSTTDEELNKTAARAVSVAEVEGMLSDYARDTSASDTSLAFSINPNADPTYTISGFQLKYSDEDSSKIATISKGMGEQNLTVIVSAGLDQVNVDPASIKVWVKEISSGSTVLSNDELRAKIAALVSKVKEIENDAKIETEAKKEKLAALESDEAYGWKLIIDNSDDTNPSEATVTVSSNLPGDNYVKQDSTYAIVVTGYDKDKIDLSQKTLYGFKGAVSAVRPNVSFSSPANLSYFASSKYNAESSSDSDKLQFTGIAVENNVGMALKSLEATLSVTDEITGKEIDGATLSVTINGDSEHNWTDVKGFTCVHDSVKNVDTWTFTPSECEGYSKVMTETEGLMRMYTLKVKATGAGSANLSEEASLSVHIDTTKPEVLLSSITPSVSGEEYFGGTDKNTYVNGTITVKGNVTEQNLSEVTYDIWASTKLDKELSAEDSILAGVSEYLDYLKNEKDYKSDLVIDGSLGKVYQINQSFPTGLLTQYFIHNEKIDADKPIKVRIVVSAKDTVGNVGSYSSYDMNGDSDFIVYQETDRPKITFGNANTTITDKNGVKIGTNLFGTTNNNKLSISVVDDDYIAEIKAYVYKVDEDEPFVTGSTFPKKTTASWNYTLPSDEGKYFIEVEAYDYVTTDVSINETGKAATGKFCVAVDSGTPSIEISSPTAGSYQRETIAVSGTVSKAGTTITGELVQVITTEEDGKTKTEEKKVADAVISTVAVSAYDSGNKLCTWTGTAKLPSNASGTYKLVYAATDIYEQTSSTSKSFSVDITAPSFALSTEDKTIFTKEDVYTAKGTISDGVNTSGIKGFYYSLEEPAVESDSYKLFKADGKTLVSGWNVAAVAATTTTGEYTWTANVDLTGISSVDGTEAHTVYFAVVDEAGNVSLISMNADSSSLKVTRDTEAPVTTLLGTGLKKPAKDSEGDAGDKDEIGNLILPENSELSASITYYVGGYGSDGTYSLSGTVTEASGSFTVKLDGDPATVNPETKEWTITGKTVDGTYAHEIVVEDEAGNKTTQKINVIRDTVEPTFIVSNNTTDRTALVINKVITEENSNYSTADGKHYYLLSGKWQDTTSGTKKLQYRVSPKHSTEGGVEVYTEGWSEWRNVEEAPESTAETSWSVKVPMSEGYGIGAGVGLEGRAIDAAGNISVAVADKDASGNINDNATEHKGLTLDFSVPSIEKTSGDVPAYIKQGETLSVTGKYGDKFSVEKVECVAKLNGEVVASGTKGYTFLKTDSTPIIVPGSDYLLVLGGTFSITLDPSAGESEGKWTFEVTVTDRAGRSTKLETITTFVDTVKPVWNDAALSVNKAPYSYTDENTHTWYKSLSMPFAGKYAEAGSGIDHVDYTITQADSAVQNVTDRLGTVVEKDDGVATGFETFSANLGEFSSKMDGNAALYNTVRFVAVDKAGNESDPKELRIYLDTESPELACTNDATESTNGSKDIVAKGTYKDDSSGVKSVKLELTYTDGNNVKHSVELGTNSETKVEAQLTEGANWTYTIPASKLGTNTYAVKATVEDVAGNSVTSTIFNIQSDKEPPVFNTPTVTTTSTKYKVYKPDQNVETYYLNNTEVGKTFTISGIATDNFDIATVELTLSGTKNGVAETKNLSTNSGIYTFSGIDLTGWTGSVTATLVAKDKAGNTNTTKFDVNGAIQEEPDTTKELKLTLNFDTEAPEGKHDTDSEGADKIFRVGLSDNATGTDALNTNVGDKYSSLTWGNSKAVNVRGFFDDNSASGVSIVYYKVIAKGTNTLTEDALAEKATNFKANYDKSEKSDTNGYTGYFMPLSANETKTVYFKNGTADESASITSNFNTLLSGFDEGHNYLLLVAVDNVGNAALDSVKYDIQIDMNQPTLTPTSNATQVTNGAAPVKADGICGDTGSGVKDVSIEVSYFENSQTSTPTTFELPATLTDSNAKWNISIPGEKFPVDSDYTVKATVTDNAGNSYTTTVFNIQVDKTPPEFNTPTVKTTSTKYSVYNADTDTDINSNTYFVNPEDGTFEISGVASDNFGVGTVELSISGTKNGAAITLPAEDASDEVKASYKKTNGVFSFDNIDLSGWTGTAVATLTVTDKAGNKNTTKFENGAIQSVPDTNKELKVILNIDTTAPAGRHALDDFNKDLFFRIGSYDNDDISSSHDLWNSNLDEDVGGKYAKNTWSKSKTIKVRGLIEDNDGGSEVKMIYYKVVKSSGTTMDETALRTLAENFLANYNKSEKNNADGYTGYFAPLSANVNKRVFFTSSTGKIARKVMNDAGTGAVDAQDSTITGNDKTIYEVENATKISDTRYYATIPTNYDATLSGFGLGTNYLILVAEDNVGNAALDSVIVDSQVFSNASLNVDEETPEISSDQSGTQYTNGSKNIDLAGEVTDAASGVNGVTIEVTKVVENTKTVIAAAGGNATTKNDSTWNYTINGATLKNSLAANESNVSFAVKAYATDKAQNEKSINVCNIQFDTTPPAFKTPSVATDSTTGNKVNKPDENADVFYINNSNGNTFTISGVATDNIEVESVELSISGKKSDGTDITLPSNTEIDKYKKASGVYSFEELDLKDFDGSKANIKATLKVTDIAGNSITKDITLKCDTTKPFFVADTDTNYFKVDGKRLSTTNWFNKSTLSFEGNLSDEGGSGIDYVEYTITKAGESPSEPDNISTSGTFKANLGEFITKIGTDGTAVANTVSLVAVDKVGNRGTAKTVSIYYDGEMPNATAEDSSVTIYINKEGTIASVSGTATDNASGIASVVINLNDKEIVKTTVSNTDYGTLTLGDASYDSTEKLWSRTWSVANIAVDKLSIFGTGDADKAYSLDAVVTDNAGNSYTVKNLRTVMLDTTAPTVTLNAPTDADKTSTDREINGKIDLSGTITDGNTLPTTAITGIQVSKGTVSGTGDITWEKVGGTGTDKDDEKWTDLTGLTLSGNYTFEAKDFVTTNLDDNTFYKLRAVATDQAGNVGYSPDYVAATDSAGEQGVLVKVSQDSDRPILNFNNIEYSSTLSTFLLRHGTRAQVTGRIEDDDDDGKTVIKKIIVSATEYTGADGETVPTNLLGNEAAVEKVLANGDFTIEPTNTADGTKTFYIYIEDNGGKKYWTSYTSVAGSVTTNDKLQNPKIKVKGERKKEWDEKEFTYKSDSKNPTMGVGKGLPYASNADGATVATDSLGNTFATNNDNSNLNASFIVGGTDRRYVKFYFTGTDASGIASMSATFTKTETDESTTPPTSTTRTLATLSTPSEWTGTQDETVAEWTTAVLDTNDPETENNKPKSWGTGQISVSVTIIDRVGNENTSTYSFMADNTAPNIDISKPESGSHETQAVTIAGTAYDEGGADTDTIKWAICDAEHAGLTDQTAIKDNLTWNKFMKTGKTAKNWEFDFDDSGVTDAEKQAKTTFANGNPLLDIFDNTTYATPVDGVYPLKVYLMATDKIGNFTITTDYIINHDPAADRPQLTFSYPTTKDYTADTTTQKLAATLGGIIRASGQSLIPLGTATTKEVYFQLVQESATSFTKDYVSGLEYEDSTTHETKKVYTIVTAADILGSEYTKITGEENAETKAELLRKYGFTSESDMTSWWGIKANGSASWNFSINEHDELDTGSTPNLIKVRVCGVNSNNKFGAWSDGDDIIHIRVAEGVPEFTYSVAQFNDTPVINSTPTIEQTYTADMYLKGKWYIVITAEDDTLIKTMEATEGATSVIGVVSETIPATGKKTVKMIVPMSEESGNHQYTVTAKDENGNTSKMPFSVNIDNTAPTLANIKSSEATFSNASGATYTTNTIENSDGYFTLSGESVDEDSGVEYVAFYYMREKGTPTEADKNAGKNHVIFDPLNPNAVVADEDDETTQNVDETDAYRNARVKMDDLKERTITQGTTSYHLYAKKVTGSMPATNQFASSTELDLNHVRVGGLIEIGGTDATAAVGSTPATSGTSGVYKKITAIGADKKTVTFEGNLPDKTQTTAYFPIAQVIDANNGQNRQESNTGNYVGKFKFDDNKDDGDGMPESFNKAGSLWTWDATIYSNNMPDGPVSLVVLAFDKAGNVSGETYLATVSNNAPRLAKVYLGTDLNHSGSYSDGEFETYNIAAKSGANEKLYTITTAGYTEYAKDSANKWQPTDSTRGSFTVKNKLAVLPEIVGGNGEINLVFNAADSTTGTDGKQIGTAVGKTATIASTDSDKHDIIGDYWELSSALGGDAAAHKVSFTFWDSTEMTTSGTDSLYAFLRVNDLVVAQNDSVQPNVVVSKFDWKQAGGGTYIDESTRKDVYKNNIFYAYRDEEKTEDGKTVVTRTYEDSPLGHIELEDDWKETATYEGRDSETNATLKKEYDGDPKVSGKIVVRGTAYDETLLGSLSFYMSDFDSSSATAPITLATYGSSGWNTNTIGTGNSAKAATMADNYYEVTVTDEYLDQTGHKVNWEVAIDTAHLTNTTKVDAVFAVIAHDAAYASATTDADKKKHTSAERTATEDAGIATQHRPSYQMDVVPYIMGISTSLDGAYSSDPTAYSRSALGVYPVLRGEEGIIVTGFNLKASATPTVSLGSVTSSSKDSITLSIPAAATSGDFDVTVSSVQSLNNKNSVAVEYNKEPNSSNNLILNNRRCFYVWGNSHKTIDATLDSTIRYPTFRVGPSGEEVFSFDLGGDMTYLYKNETPYLVGTSFTQWYDTAVSVDNKGNLYGVALNGDNAANGSKAFDANARFHFYPLVTSNLQAWTYTLNNGAFAWENASNGTIYNPNRVLNPKLVTVRNDDNTISYVYATYYDASEKLVKFRAGTYGLVTKYTQYATSTRFSWNSNYNLYTNSDNYNGDYYVLIGDTYYPLKYESGQYTRRYSVTGYTAKQTFDSAVYTKSEETGPSESIGNYSTAAGSKGSAPGYQTIASGSAASVYSALAVASDGTAIVCWYDSTEKALKLKYNSDPLNGDTWKAGAATDNKTEIIIDSGLAGWYPDMVVDGDGGIHIAYYGAKNGDLKYAYLTSYTDTVADVCTVDSFLSVGTRASISVSATKKGFKVGDTTVQKYVPFISYYMGAFTATQTSVRTAWPVALGENESAIDKSKTPNTYVDGAVNDQYTGSWEVQTLPLDSFPSDYTIGIGVKATATSTAAERAAAVKAEGNIILGYGTTEGLETARLY